MVYGKNIAYKDYNRVLNNMVKRYEFETVAYSVEANETLPRPFVAVFGNSSIVVEMFMNTFVPAAQGQPVCFMSNISREVKNESNQ